MAAAELEAKALAWIEEHPVFEKSYVAPLKPASEFAPSLYNYITESLDVGIGFKRPIIPTDSAADLQEAVEYVAVNHVEVAEFEVPAGWYITAKPPTSRFDPGEDGQEVRIESFDGETLRWTVDSKTFFSLSGIEAAILEEARMCPDRPIPEGHDFQVRKDFRGVLHFESSVQRSL
mmetsp:Transcript_136057/g.379206  ORF Transcript_136057/g.379206 Transcript_136057/m.379206 type:complete len:176 (-) Transcript_136057:72-599(-)